MAKVRFATVMDIDVLTALGRQFHAESPYNWLPYDEAAVAEMLLASMRESTCDVFVAETDNKIVGTAGVTMTRFYFTADQYYATELFWFVDRDHRKGRVGMDLKQAMEVWGAAKGCKFLTLVSFRGKAPRHYEPLETSFARRLQ